MRQGDIGIHEALALIGDEYTRARVKFPRFHSGHEGYAVLLEEVDELWDAIRADEPKAARDEAIQVAAMALAFILET